MADKQTKYILIIHGPNMNLINKFKNIYPSNITLDKINKTLKQEIINSEIKTKIIQTNDEIKAVKLINTMRNKLYGIILIPTVWQNSGFILQNILDLLKIPFVTISTGEEEVLFKGIKNINKKDFFQSCKIAVETLFNNISK
tara:strand:+ start:3576 stop:4001 length:426 start_codon:yes stop_codon:yes gene_type:complete